MLSSMAEKSKQNQKTKQQMKILESWKQKNEMDAKERLINSRGLILG